MTRPSLALLPMLLLGCPKTAPAPAAVDLTTLHGTLLDTPRPLIGSFQATAHTGETRDQADLMGHPTVMWFFPAANTRGCTVEGCGYRDLYGEFEQLGVHIVGVSFTSVEDNASWVADMEFPYEIWHDGTRDLATYYQAIDAPDDKYAKRRTRVLDREGNVVVEYNDSIIVGAHPQEVLEDIQALKAAGKL